MYQLEINIILNRLSQVQDLYFEICTPEEPLCCILVSQKEVYSVYTALASHDYILKIVPTVYEDMSGKQRYSYQYTVANKVKILHSFLKRLDLILFSSLVSLVLSMCICLNSTHSTLFWKSRKKENKK